MYRRRDVHGGGKIHSTSCLLMPRSRSPFPQCMTIPCLNAGSTFHRPLFSLIRAVIGLEECEGLSLLIRMLALVDASMIRWY